MGIEEENRLIKERISKLKQIENFDINPYPYKFDKTHSSITILNKYDKLEAEEKTEEIVSVAGRIMQLRDMGKAAFLHIQDEDGKIQIYLRKDDLKEIYKQVKKLDIGDFIGIKGIIFKTRTGEITVHTKEFTLLCKTLRPLPEKYHGIQDKELRYRKRYLDLIMNQDVKEIFKKRSLLLKCIRDFMHNRGYMEVETPALQTIYGGANARPFKTHINAWNMPMYLSVSPELYLKRLIVGGFEKVFTICKNFRNEGVDHSHNPEFTMIEAYAAYQDYNDMMKLIEECYEYCCLEIYGTTKITLKKFDHGKVIGEQELDFKAPWKKITMAEAIKKTIDIDVLSMDVNQIFDYISNRGLDHEGDKTWGYGVMTIFEELVEENFIEPIHIIDRPKESSPLCKQHRTDDRLIEQNEPACMGMELGNMYSELNNPIIQRKELEKQAAQLRAGGEECHPMDEDFVQAIECGMPPTGGIGWGIDRMAILLLGVESIRDVILFPTMKPIDNDKTVDGQNKNAQKELKKSLE